MESQMSKKCSRCEIEKDLCDYYFDKKRNFYYSHCKKCNALAGKTNRNKRKDEFNKKRKLTRVKYKEQEKEYRKKYYDEKIRPKNKNILKTKKEKTPHLCRIKLTEEEKKQYHIDYRKKNREKNRLRAIKYRIDNKDDIQRRAKERYKNTFINKQLLQNTRVRIRKALSGNRKSSTSILLLGASTEEVRLFISSKFTKGMTWDNYGKNGWHLDHIKPCSSFNLSDPDEQKKCFHYTNLQPLWATKEIAMSYGEGPDYIGNLEKGYTYSF